MAVNMFKTDAMRGSQQPGGCVDLPPHRQEKVSLDNALATVSRKPADAQEKAEQFWILEEPATSLMWLFEPVAGLVERESTFVVTTDVCM